jgi:predicted sulfurtransferase
MTEGTESEYLDVTLCAMCEVPMDSFTMYDKEHPECHRCCSAECMEHYYTLYHQGWYLEV